MDAAGAGSLSSTRVAIVAGKGGVGSSTVAAAASLAAAQQGADVLFVAVDGRPGMGPLLGGAELTDRDRVLRRLDGGGRVRGRTIPAEQAFSDYLELKGVGGLLRRAATATSLPMIAAATPGLEHLLVLGMVKQLERSGAADLIVVDAPPAGHAAPFLRAAHGLSDVVASGPVAEQADEVIEMLGDPRRAQVMLVTLPEETPVNEVIELAADIDDALGMAFLPLVVNACWPDRPGLAKTPAMAARSHKTKLSAAAKEALESASAFGRIRLEQQARQLDRLRAALDLPIVRLPRLTATDLGPDELSVLAAELIGAGL